MNKIICYFKGHIWIEWEHHSDRPRKEFFKNTIILKNPECARCGKRHGFKINVYERLQD